MSIAGNNTLTALSNGLHNITVYAWTLDGTAGASETAYFCVQELEPFPTVAAASTISVAVAGTSLVLYWKRKKP